MQFVARCASIGRLGLRDGRALVVVSSDGVVPYASAHLDGAASEQIVTSGHSVQKTAAAILALQEDARNWLRPAPERPRMAEPEPSPNVTQPSHETLSELKEWLASSAQLPLA